MTERLTRLREDPLVHVVSFAIFPVVFLWAANAQERIEPAAAFRPLGIIVVGALMLYFALTLMTRDRLRAGFLTSLALLLFFSFGHVREIVDPSGIGFHDNLLFIQFLLLLGIGVTLSFRAGRYAIRTTRILNAVALVLVVMNTVAIVTAGSSAVATGRHFVLPGVDLQAVQPGRDVYYLIFDRYAGIRTLRELYGFDNRPMMGFLESRGFFVAEDSLANYPRTAHSLASSLNMTYLDDLADRQGTDSGDWDPILASMQGSRVATGFQDLGYRYHHIGSWWEPTRLDPAADSNHQFTQVTEFSGVLLETTMWPALASRLEVGASFEKIQYQRVRYQFSTIQRIADDAAPTFTFAHFLLPHTPYVNDARGGFVSAEKAARWGEHRAYVEQLRYTNESIRELVQDLTAGPDASDPIILIQSDEGPHPPGLDLDEEHYDWTRASDRDLGEKLRVLNAYFLPGNGDLPYETISPVNTFRLIFSRYFGAELPLLPDRTFVYRDASRPYLFSEVTARLRD